MSCAPANADGKAGAGRTREPPDRSAAGDPFIGSATLAVMPPPNNLAALVSPLVPRNRRVLDALDSTFRTAPAIALRAGLPTRDRVEHAAVACERLVHLGLAERMPSHRLWRRLPPFP